MGGGDFSVILDDSCDRSGLTRRPHPEQHPRFIQYYKTTTFLMCGDGPNRGNEKGSVSLHNITHGQ